MIDFQSYINKMIFVLSVDEEIIPDPHQLCDDLEESLKFMLTLQEGLSIKIP